MHSTLTRRQHKALERLHEAAPGLVDREHEKIPGITLNTLEDLKLARHEGEGLYRITGGGIAHLRGAKPIRKFDRYASLRENIHQHIKAHPGVASRELYALASTRSKESIRRVLRTLRAEGLVGSQRDGRAYRHYPRQPLREAA